MNLHSKCKAKCICQTRHKNLSKLETGKYTIALVIGSLILFIHQYQYMWVDTELNVLKQRKSHLNEGTCFTVCWVRASFPPAVFWNVFFFLGQSQCDWRQCYWAHWIKCFWFYDTLSALQQCFREICTFCDTIILKGTCNERNKELPSQTYF